MFDLIPEWFKQTKGGQEMAAESAAQRRSEREELVHTIEVARAQLSSSLPPLDAALEKARAKEAEAKLALKAASAAVVEASNGRWSASQSYDLVVARAEGALRQSADPAIDRFLDELAGYSIKVSRTPVSTNVIERSISGKPLKVESSLEETRALLEAVATAQQECEALRLVVDQDVSAQLQEIRVRLGLPMPAVAA